MKCSICGNSFLNSYPETLRRNDGGSLRMPMGLRKNKAASNITVFTEVSLNSVFYDNEVSFPFGMLQGLNFGQELIVRNGRYRNLVKFYSASFPRVPTEAFACVRVHILHNIRKWRVCTRGGRMVYGPKTSDQADKNAVHVKQDRNNKFVLQHKRP